MIPQAACHKRRPDDGLPRKRSNVTARDAGDGTLKHRRLSYTDRALGDTVIARVSRASHPIIAPEEEDRPARIFSEYHDAASASGCR
jgi:hypothetical protein